MHGELLLPTSDVDYEYLPQNGDAFDISITLDDIDDGSNVTKLSDFAYVVSDTFTIGGNTTLFDESRQISFGSNLENFRVTNDAGIILGNYTESSLGDKGCFITANGVTGNLSVISGNNDGSDAGDFFFHSCLIFIGDGSGAYFLRGYRGADHRVRLVDCNISGDFGGRYQGTRSNLIRCNFIDSQGTVGPFTTKAPMSISEITISDSIQAFYWNNTLGGSAAINNLIIKRISDRLIRAADSGSALNPSETLTLRDWDISEWDINGVEPDFILWDSALTNSTINWVRTLSISSASGGGRVAVFNSANTEISNELSVDGTYSTVDMIERSFSGKNNTRDTFSDGTVLGPFTVKLREYGKIFLVQTFSGQDPATFVWFKINNSLTTAATATLALANSNPRTMDEIYDHAQATYEQSSNMEYQEKITASGLTLTFDLDVTIMALGSNVTYDLDNDTVQYTGVLNGTKLTTATLANNHSLTFADAGTYSGTWIIPSTGTVNVDNGVTDLSSFTFANGATINNTSASAATVNVQSDVGIVTTSTGGGTITIEAPSPSVSIIGFPNNSTVTLSQAGINLDTLNNTNAPYSYEILTGESNIYTFKVISPGKQDFITTINTAETTTAQYLGLDANSEQTIHKPALDFMELMQSDIAFQRIVSTDTTLNSQLWEVQNWQTEWNTAAVADTPSTGEISTWIGYLTTTNYANISFNTTTGEVS